MLRPACLACLVLAPVVVAGPVRGAPDKREAPQEAIVRLTNAFRRSQGRAELMVSKQLADAAQQHAENMAKQDKLGHVFGGKKAGDRAAAAGYKPALLLENISLSVARVDPTRDMMDRWKKSPGHRKNLLDPACTETGVGVARSASGKWYGCQLFAQPAKRTFAVWLENRTKDTLRLRAKGGAESFAVEAGKGLKFEVEAASPDLALEVLPKAPAAKPIPFTARDGERYAVVSDGGELKVQPAPKGKAGALDGGGSVEGTVTFKGRPVATGKVSFHSAKGKPVVVEIHHGKYSAKEVPLGSLRVTCEFEGAPKKFLDPKTSPLRFEARGGKNVVDIVLE
jgi:hypothetical protein